MSWFCWSKSPAFLSHLPGLVCGDLVLGEGAGGGGDSDNPLALPQAGQLCPKPTGHLAKQAGHSSEPGLAVGWQPGPRCPRPCAGRVADRSAGGQPVSTASHSSSHLPVIYLGRP